MHKLGFKLLRVVYRGYSVSEQVDLYSDSGIYIDSYRCYLPPRLLDGDVGGWPSHEIAIANIVLCMA